MMWPCLIELDPGETFALHTSAGTRTVTLLKVNELWEPDFWIEGNESRQTLREAEIGVDVSGVRHVLRMRPYEMPSVVNGLRLYAEASNTAGTCCQYAALPGMRKAARLSVQDARARWGPGDLRFPIRGYRWRSATYNNTWNSLVPYNLLYYHRGEDFGAIPDQLEVIAVQSGVVTVSPLPVGGNSNTLAVQSADGTEIRYAHMNLPTIDPSLVIGAQVRAGQVLGRTGSTWGGKPQQHLDPHLHVSVHRSGTTISAYPMLVDAYFREYDDRLLPNAGGYRFASPGQTVMLDGARSLPRSGRTIVSYQWRLHDGRVVDGPAAQLYCERPGLFSEELLVRTDDGNEDRDFLQLRVYDPNAGRDLAFGWAYHHPVRGVRPKEPVRFWNRLARTVGAVRIDYGDGSAPEEIEQEQIHRYASPGLYVATLSATGPRGEPATVKMRVFVED